MHTVFTISAIAWLLVASFLSHGQRMVTEVDSSTKSVSIIKRHTRGTGGGYSGNGPSWSKHKAKVFDFDKKLKRESLIIRRYFGCGAIDIKRKITTYENGRWATKTRNIHRWYLKRNKTKTREQ